ncbi:hypothetical protein FPQ18DRAFT_111614 [Pyronema domesticum]|nr:hypothetical protein FPQ18DRAFT_111614 [Pyronema domesticum]
MRTATPPAALHAKMIRQFSVYEIGVRSKQDGLAKCIVCGQALWNLVQCLSRVGLKLPVSPLELHTALYIVNLVVIYSVWWSKPVDLGRPILLCLMQDYNASIEEPVQSTDENSRWVYGPPIPPPAHLVAFVVKYGEEPTEKASLDASKVVPDLVSALKTVQQAKEFVELISETETQIPKEVHKEHYDALVTARRNLQDLRGFSEVGPNYASVFRKLDLNSEMDIIERETYNGM